MLSSGTAAGSSARTRGETATPSAPASTTAVAFPAVMPPMPTKGMSTASAIAATRSVPTAYSSSSMSSFEPVATPRRHQGSLHQPSPLPGRLRRSRPSARYRIVTEDIPGNRNREVVVAEVNSVGVDGLCEVDTVVNDERDVGIAGQFSQFCPSS